LASFRLWLQSKNYSSSTIRNYLVDLNKYFEFCVRADSHIRPSLESSESFQIGRIQGSAPTIENLSKYLASIQSDPNYRRYLSSLAKYFDFALDQKLIDHNPLKAALRSVRAPLVGAPSLESILPQFSQYLSSHHTAPSTIRNYINDLKQYISWLETPPASGHLPLTGEENPERLWRSPLSRGETAEPRGVLSS
jgi:site-specific recombinase XerD